MRRVHSCGAAKARGCGLSVCAKVVQYASALSRLREPYASGRICVTSLPRSVRRPNNGTAGASASVLRAPSAGAMRARPLDAADKMQRRWWRRAALTLKSRRAASIPRALALAPFFSLVALLLLAPHSTMLASAARTLRQETPPPPPPAQPPPPPLPVRDGGPEPWGITSAARCAPPLCKRPMRRPFILQNRWLHQRRGPSSRCSTRVVPP